MFAQTRTAGLALLLGTLASAPQTARAGSAEPQVQRHVVVRSSIAPDVARMGVLPSIVEVTDVIQPGIATGVDESTLGTLETMLDAHGFDIRTAALRPKYKSVWCPDDEMFKIVCCNVSEVLVMSDARGGAVVECADEVLIEGAGFGAEYEYSVTIEHVAQPTKLRAIQGPEVRALYALLGANLQPGQDLADQIENLVRSRFSEVSKSRQDGLEYYWEFDRRTMTWIFICTSNTSLEVNLESEGTFRINLNRKRRLLTR